MSALAPKKCRCLPRSEVEPHEIVSGKPIDVNLQARWRKARRPVSQSERARRACVGSHAPHHVLAQNHFHRLGEMVAAHFQWRSLVVGWWDSASAWHWKRLQRVYSGDPLRHRAGGMKELVTSPGGVMETSWLDSALFALCGFGPGARIQDASGALLRGPEQVVIGVR
jgi:hypothetical protein